MRGKTIVLALVFCSAATTASAQGFSLNLRGGMGLPVGAFAESPSGQSQPELLTGAKAGFGYGLDAALFLNRMVGLYAGFDQVAFDCDEQACGQNNNYTVSGVTAGLKLTPFRMVGMLPYLQGGVTFHELKGSYRSGSVQDLTSDRAPGFEVGAGVAIPLLNILAFSPQVRYVGQSPRAKIRGIEYQQEAERTVGYFTVDLGLDFNSLSGGGWRSMQQRTK